MGTTTNNSWPYPESSDYVADGATAIENLADAIDGGLGNVGLLSRGHIGSQTKSVSSVITTTPATMLSTTVDVVAGRDYLVMYSGWTYATSTTMNVEFVLYVDGVSYQVMNVSINSTGDNGNLTMARVITAPSTGSVTFEVQAYTSTGTTYMRATSGAVKPSIIMMDMGDL
jgi:hypothetical protein